MLLKLCSFIFLLVLSTVPALAQNGEDVFLESTPTQESLSQPASDSAVLETTPAPAAVQPVNLTVSPISLNLVTDPGTTTSASIRIRNNSSEPEFLTLRLATFAANETGDAPVIRDFESQDEYQSWLRFSEPTFRVGPGEWKTIPLTFSPPASAALGYYYAILVERQQEVEVAEGQSLISGVPAILVLSEVNSPLAKRQLELVSFTANKKLFEYLPAEFSLTIKNSGNIQTMPMGDLFIDGQRTSDLAAIQLNPAKGMILPNSQRTFTVAWDDGFPRYLTTTSPTGEKSTQLAWEFSRVDRFKIGKFSATALFVYDDGSRDVPTQATLDFWIIPWRMILLILTLIVLDVFRSKIIAFFKRTLKIGKARTDTT